MELKDSTGRLERDAGTRRRSARTGLSPFFIGRDHMILEALELRRRRRRHRLRQCGAEIVRRSLSRLLRGRLVKQRGCRRWSIRCGRRSRLHTFPAVIKEAMKMIGYPAGPCRKPVGAMPRRDARKILAAVLQKLRDENYLPEGAASVRA